MKRILYSNHILWALSLMALFSCQSETLERTEGASVPLEIRTAAHSTLTRTTLGPDDRSVIWTEGDDIAVFDNVAPKHMFTASIADGIARFQGNITPKTTDFLAVYPYELASESLLGGHIVVNLPSTQTASLNAFSTGLNVSVAKCSRNVDGSPSFVSFINVCQVFKFTVPAYAKDQITSIQLQADVVLAGQMNIDYSDYNPVVSTSEQGSKAITILPPSGSSTFAEGTYCIVTAPATLNGFTFLLTAGGKTYRQHSSSTIGGGSSVIADLRTLDLIDTPQVTAQHVYTNDVLQGTALSITAPTPDKQRRATVKNAAGTVVRTFAAGPGTLQSDETASKTVYITGLPFRSEPPTSDLWSKSGNGISFNNGYVEMGNYSSGSQTITYNHLSVPAGTKVQMDHKVYMHAGAVGHTYTLSLGDQTAYSRKNGSYNEYNVQGIENITAQTLSTSVRCYNSYGASATYIQVYKIAVTYGE